MKRYLHALVVAYAASMTLLAAWLAVREQGYRRFFDLLMQGKHGGRPVHFPGLSAIALDFGIELTPWDELSFHIADVGPNTLASVSMLILASCLVAAFIAGQNRPVADPGAKDVSRLTRRAAPLSLLVGLLALALTWGCIRWRVLHPNPWPTVVILLAQTAAALLGFLCGSWDCLRGRRRTTAASLALASLVPLVAWGLIGIYAWVQWQHRLVPNDLPMNLAKMMGSSLMRLEASVEYPNRLETDRLLMFYDRLSQPGRDAEAMDRHLARMERMLGGPLRAKVYWVRGNLRRMGLSNLSVHGLALGSGESPSDWEARGSLDRHELAHAAIDQYRTVNADPPYFLHEGWAEMQSGVGSPILARQAWDQRSAAPSLGIREMAGADWYHKDAGAVYLYGGAFVDFLIQRDGAGKFLRLYNESREDRFGAVVREVYGTDLGALEAEFWEDVRRRVDETRVPSMPTKKPPG